VRAMLLVLWLLCQPPLLASQQHSIPQPKASQQHPKADTPGTQDSPFVVKVLDAENAHERAAEAAKEREAKAAADSWVVRLTKYLVIVGGIQALIFLGQLWMMWKAGDTTKRQLRAYVFVESAIAHSTQSGGWVKVVIKNFGQTPAYRYTATLDTAIMDPSTVPRFPRPGSGTPGGSLAPSATIKMTKEFPQFTVQDGIAVRQGTKILYVFGQIEYTDAFNTTRYTRYCHAWGGHYGSGDGDIAYAEHGNEAS
jgi:hypothetical protein